MKDSQEANGFSPLDGNSSKLLTEIQKKAIAKLTKLVAKGEKNIGVLTSKTRWNELFLVSDQTLKELASINHWIGKIESGLVDYTENEKVVGLYLDNNSSIQNQENFLFPLKVTSLESLKLRIHEIAYKGIDSEFLSRVKKANPQLKDTNESIKQKAMGYLDFVYNEFVDFSIKPSQNKVGNISYEYKLKSNTKEAKRKAEEIVSFLLDWSYKLDTGNQEVIQKKSTKYSRDLLKYQTTPIKKQLSIFPPEQKQKLREIEQIINAKNHKINPIRSKSSKYDYIPDKLVLKDGEFTDDELKAVISIMILINKAKERKELKNIDASLSYFNLNITEFNRYFGVPTTKRGTDKKLRFTGRKADEAKQALLKVSKKVIATHFEKKLKSSKSKNTKGKMITEVSPIINPLKVSVNGEYEIGDKLPLEEGEITIAVNRIFFENIGESGNFFFIPENINLEITTAGGGKRVSAGVRNFGVWIHSITPKKDGTWEVTYPKLIEILWLQKYQQEGRKSLIKKNIKTAFDNAIARGILEDVTEGVSADGHVKYILHFTQLYINNK